MMKTRICCLVAAFLTIASHASATIYLQEDFQEATLGGTRIISPSSNTTGVAPSPGGIFFFGDDNFEVATGINSSQGLRSKDVTEGPGTLILQTNAAVQIGYAQVDFMLHGIGSSGRVASPNPFRIQLSTDAGYSDIATEISTPIGGSGFNIFAQKANGVPGVETIATNAVVNDTPYRLTVDFDFTVGADGQFGVTLRDLTSNTVVLSSLGRNIRNTVGGTALNYLYFTFGSANYAADNSGGPEYVLIDNILVSDPIPAPEPNSMILASLGIIGMFRFARRRQK